MDPVGGGPKTQSQGCYRGPRVVDAPVGEAPVVPPLVNDSDSDWRFGRSASDRSSGGFELDPTRFDVHDSTYDVHEQCFPVTGTKFLGDFKRELP